MKIAVTANKPTLGDNVPVRFSRGAYVIIADPDTLTFQYLENEYQSLKGEVCSSLAKSLSQKGVDIAVASYWAPVDAQACMATGVRIATVPCGTIRDALQQFKTASTARMTPVPLAS